MNRAGLLACHECDLLQLDAEVPEGGVLRCRRCHGELYRNRANALDRAFALALGASVLLLIANAYPIVGLSVNGTVVETTLIGAVVVLYKDGMWPLAGLVFATTVLTPFLQAASILWMLVPLRLNRVPWGAAPVFRLSRVIQPWGMTEVLILGLLVALVKLAHIASVVVDVGLWSFGALMLVLAAAAASFDSRELWARIATLQHTGGQPHDARPVLHDWVSASECGLVQCHDCGLLAKVPAHAHELRCPRCGASMHRRKADSLTRTWALLFAAMVLYVPANALPVMYTSSLFGAQKDTILSGVVYLWTSGSWPLALVVFIASIAVPMLKIIAIAFLAISTRLHSSWSPEQRTRIYRVVELVGRWSMLDIYVITMLVALVQFKALATIQAGPAAIAFGAVVVLTMFAAMSFDPRLIWDAAKQDHVRSPETS
ncbi:paraquat-inducible protein A [Paraburkholderia sp. BL10I2N1]|uniref:paraquat-inducible protein A n=1 Tax=Paraburkholderia sp. BL10I2N1 TaxID=1938796 RepID=UPI00105F5108|nr:paraquat-inducible protein A [Paraburkholderia sp. BL10I2N1]TDN57826.1 paraquat-inducible protein A [Paraburkholderia sp. BL10I2N1]